MCPHPWTDRVKGSVPSTFRACPDRVTMPNSLPPIAPVSVIHAPLLACNTLDFVMMCSILSMSCGKHDANNLFEKQNMQLM